MNIKRLSGPWVIQAEHGFLRVCSLVCSLYSAYAIHLLLAPLGAVDKGELVLTWGFSGAIGIMGYVVPRGLAYRMMRGESIRVYAPICLLIEFLDIACNYLLAASSVGTGQFLSVPLNQQVIAVVLQCTIRSVPPLFSLLLAAVDMDLERKKDGTAARVVQGQGSGRMQSQMQVGRPNGTNGTQMNGPQTASRGPAGAVDKDKQRAQRANLFGGPRQQGPAAQPVQAAAARGAGNSGGNGAGSVGTLLHDPEKWVPVE